MKNLWQFRLRREFRLRRHPSKIRRGCMIVVVGEGMLIDCGCGRGYAHIYIDMCVCGCCLYN